MRKSFLAVAVSLALVAGAALAAVTQFNYLTPLTGSEVIANMASPVGNVFKTLVLAQYVTRTYQNGALTTVAALPTCNSASKGYTYQVTDANAPTYGGTLTGSSTTFAVAICDGTNWTAH